MVIHSIWDFTFLYYKYHFAMKSGRLRQLTCPINWKGTVIEKDISVIYYSIAEIEKQRRKLEEQGHSVVSSICFDMPSKRKELADGEDYKEGRQKTLKDEDFENIELIETILSEAGHNTYRFEGYEADDLVTFLAKNYKDVFDYTIIYTPDKDLAVNIDEKVGMEDEIALRAAAARTNPAFSMLSGRSHQVMTGLSVVAGSKEISVTEVTDVYFRELTEEEIRSLEM